MDTINISIKIIFHLLTVKKFHKVGLMLYVSLPLTAEIALNRRL